MAEPVSVHETHSAFVLLAGDRAFKVKKPVDLGFLDFTTLAARRRACERELELNRRLAPDVYLDVASLSGSDGLVSEHVLVMKRMPDDARLSTRASRGEPIDDDLRAVARAIADLHSRHPLAPGVLGATGTAEMQRRWADLFRLLDEAGADVLASYDVAQIKRLSHDYVVGRSILLDRRAADGHVVDGHGDLLADDVFCLPDGPRILDCLDFDDRLRAVDVLDDVAFLAMDLESLGRRAEADLFVRHYLEFSGTTAHPSLLRNYLAYRAFVRACVAAVRANQGDPTATAHARALCALALRHLRAGQVRLLLIGGAPATGKSTLARRLGEHLDADVLTSDAVRRELFAGDPRRYEPWAVAAVYAELVRRARELLAEGRDVVLDATWASADAREAAEEAATATKSALHQFECRAPVAVTVRRATRRAANGSDDSEADADTAALLAGNRDPWPDAAPVPTDGDVDTALAVLLDTLRIS